MARLRIRDCGGELRCMGGALGHMGAGGGADSGLGLMPDANGQATENEIHLKVAKILAINFPQFPASAVSDHGVAWTTVEHGGLRSMAAGWRNKKKGVKAGLPDLDFLYGGRAYRIELKNATGSLSQEQRDERARIIAAGGLWALCRSETDVLRTLSQWGFPLRAEIFA